MIYSDPIQFTKLVISVKWILKIQEKKNHMLLFLYEQTEGNRGNGQLPINILRRG